MQSTLLILTDFVIAMDVTVHTVHWYTVNRSPLQVFLHFSVLAYQHNTRVGGFVCGHLGKGIETSESLPTTLFLYLTKSKPWLAFNME